MAPRIVFIVNAVGNTYVAGTRETAPGDGGVSSRLARRASAKRASSAIGVGRKRLKAPSGYYPVAHGGKAVAEENPLPPITVHIYLDP